MLTGPCPRAQNTRHNDCKLPGTNAHKDRKLPGTKITNYQAQRLQITRHKRSQRLRTFALSVLGLPVLPGAGAHVHRHGMLGAYAHKDCALLLFLC